MQGALAKIPTELIKKQKMLVMVYIYDLGNLEVEAGVSLEVQCHSLLHSKQARG